MFIDQRRTQRDNQGYKKDLNTGPTEEQLFPSQLDVGCLKKIITTLLLIDDGNYRKI